MNIPINGRVAIVENNYEEAKPLMSLFAKHQIPYVYYTGDLSELPSREASTNDIRLLFLDLNLVSDKGSVLSSGGQIGHLKRVLKSIIKDDNYPYAIILWSISEDNELAEQLISVEPLAQQLTNAFASDLSNARPIATMDLRKSDYMNKDYDVESGKHTVSIIEANIPKLFDSIKQLLNQEPAFGYLLNWENKVHSSADSTLQGIFQTVPTVDWKANANYLLNKLGNSYSGKHFYGQTPSDKLKSSMNALNIVFTDTLEANVNHETIADAIELDGSGATPDALSTINTKLLISNETEPRNYPGMALLCGSAHENHFKTLSNELLNVADLRVEALNVPNSNTLEEPAKKKLINEKLSAARTQIRLTWKQIYLNTTPLCDFVQKKVCHDRLILGALVAADTIHLVDDKSESIYVSPKFDWGGIVVHLVLHFRFLFTLDTNHVEPDTTAIFRVRQQLLAEIQSKLARHVSRQGVLFLDER
ncbi:MAG: hypothetical protein KBF73_05380 [Flavobacteriales bacterium]|nr:hypothetical protein [Flavobacteriales bacterium]